MTKRSSPLAALFPGVTIALIAANVLVFVWQLSLGPEAGGACVADYGAVPAQVTGAAPHAAPALAAPLTILTSMFLHAGFAHLLGNMVFLWIFGNNVEDATGLLRFALFYLACGGAAALAHIAAHAGSTVPMSAPAARSRACSAPTSCSTRTRAS